MKTPSQGYDVMHLALFADGSSLQWEMALEDVFSQECCFVSAFHIMVELRLSLLSLFPLMHLDSFTLEHF